MAIGGTEPSFFTVKVVPDAADLAERAQKALDEAWAAVRVPETVTEEVETFEYDESTGAVVKHCRTVTVRGER